MQIVLSSQHKPNCLIFHSTLNGHTLQEFQHSMTAFRTAFLVIVDAYDSCRILVNAITVDESFIQMTISLISPTNLDLDEERMGWSTWHSRLGTNFL